MKKKIDVKYDIFFEIIFAVYKIKLNGVNKVNIIIEIIKGEKIFMIKHFDKIVENIIISLLSEKEITKRNEGYYLDQIIKAGIGSLFQDNYINKENIHRLNEDFYKICYYLIKKLQSKHNNEKINIFIISWFNFLESIPEIDLTEFYNDIILQLLDIIKSNNEEESELGELYLKKIINGVIASYEEKNLDFIKNIIYLFIKSSEDKNKIENNNFLFVLFEQINIFLEKFEVLLNCEKKIETLKNMIPFDCFPSILKFILSINIKYNEQSNTKMNNEAQNKNPITKSNSIFFNLMKKVKPNYFVPQDKIKYITIFEDAIKDNLSNNLNEQNTNLIFDWITLLYNSKLYLNEEFLNNLIISMDYIKDFHLKRIIEVLYMIKVNSSKFSKEIIIKKILEKFNDKDFAEKFGFFIFNELSNESNKIIDIIDIFKGISNILKSNSDIHFIINIADILTNYLICEDKSKKVIDGLNNDQKFFKSLYKIFCYNPFDTLVLLLLTKKFELCYFFVIFLSRINLNSSDLIELSKAVQVFESQFFIDVRIKLLNPNNHTYLTKTLYAISLLLPPGPALEALSCRLKCLKMLYDFDDKEEIKIESNNFDINNDDSSIEISDYDEIDSASKNSTENMLFDELLQYMDENDKKIFEEKQIKEYIDIFELQNIKKAKKIKTQLQSFKQPKLENVIFK